MKTLTLFLVLFLFVGCSSITEPIEPPTTEQLLIDGYWYMERPVGSMDHFYYFEKNEIGGKIVVFYTLDSENNYSQVRELRKLFHWKIEKNEIIIRFEKYDFDEHPLTIIKLTKDIMILNQNTYHKQEYYLP